MWEEDVCWNKGITLLDGNCDSDILSPQESQSPLSSTGNGSPYSGGSMSPDTTSNSPSRVGDNGSIWNGSEDGDCFSPADLFSPRNFFFGGTETSPGWSLSPTTPVGSGRLPALHEWRKFDLQRKYLQQQQHLLQHFIFPEVTPLISEKCGGFKATSTFPSGTTVLSDSIVTSSTPSSSAAPTSKPCNTEVSKQTSSLSIGQRAERFLKSFKSSSSSSSSPISSLSAKSAGSEMISSTCSVEVVKPFDCHWIDCTASFLQKGSLIEHIDRSHIQPRKDDFNCFWHGCVRRNRPFNARYKLLIHMRVHTGHKPNKCTVDGCDKAFSRLENLKIHLRSHTGERPYICPHCPKAFSNSSDRAKHQRTHFDSKPYACTYLNCEKRYTDPSSLRKHAKMHYFIGGKGAKSVGVVSGKKEGQHAKRNRRKYLGGGGGNDLKPSLITLTPSSPQPVYQMVIQESTNVSNIQGILNGQSDPPSITAVPSSSSPLSAPVISIPEQPEFLSSPQTSSSPLLMQNELKMEGITADSDLDGISLGELDWISGINFDDNFDIDYLL